MTLAPPMPEDCIPVRDFATQISVSVKTIYRWRSEGRIIERDGQCEVIKLHTLNTSGARCRGGKVLVPISHDECRGNVRYLGAVEFVAALGVDPVLRRMEAGLFQ